MVQAGMQPEPFRSRVGLLELWHFDKLFVKNRRKKVSSGCLLEPIRTYLFQNQGSFSDFQKRAEEPPPHPPFPSPNCPPVNFNKLGLALGMALKLYTSLTKELRIRVRKFWRMIPTYIKLKKKTGFLPLPS